MIQLDAAAVAQVKRVQAAEAQHAGKALRAFVTEGGCSGWSYGFRFDDRTDEDTAVEYDGVTLVVDPKSLGLIDGCVITYEQAGLAAGSFKVTNPQATGTCGCGQSFSTS